MKIRVLSLHAFGPVLPAASSRDVLRAALGSFVGVGSCALLALAVPEVLGLSVMLLAPLGASAVLIFAVPNTPLAQPWSAVVGNTVSALIAVVTLHYLPGWWSPAVVVGAAIAGMLLLRALHPPGGAVALLTALDPGPALAMGFAYALVPVGLMTAALVAAGCLYHSVAGRRYPFRQPKEEAAIATQSLLSSDELASLLRRFNQSPNIGVADLGRLLAAAEADIANHRFDAVTCAEVMTPDLITTTADAPIAAVARLLRRHAIKSVPVVDDSGALLGMILQADVIRWLTTPALGIGGIRPRSRITARQMMQPPDRTVHQDMPVGRLLARLSAAGQETVPVVNTEGALVGIITRSDIMRLLLQGTGHRRAAA